MKPDTPSEPDTLSPYIGVKQVHAVLACKGSEVGYEVVYDLGTDREYRSWSPRDKFERAYLPLDGDGSRVTQNMVDNFVSTTSTITIADKMTVGFIQLANGTLYTESSACVDPANYDEALGAKICMDRAKDRVWHLLGFVLQWAKHGLVHSTRVGQ